MSGFKSGRNQVFFHYVVTSNFDVCSRTGLQVLAHFSIIDVI